MVCLATSETLDISSRLIFYLLISKAIKETQEAIVAGR